MATWWFVPVALLEAYLLVSVTPWAVLQAVAGQLRRPGHTPEDEGARLRALESALAKHARRWPPVPRLGRYEAIDRAAQASLAGLGAGLREGNAVWPHLAAYQPFQARLLDVARLACWRPMRDAWYAWTDLALVRRALDQAESAWQGLQAAQDLVDAIPGAVRAELDRLRDALAQVDALLQAEGEAGTLGLDDWRGRIRALAGEVKRAGDLLEGAPDADKALTVHEVDAIQSEVRPQVTALSEAVTHAAQERARARDALARLDSSVRLAQERWEGLKARGVRETSLVQTLAELSAQAQEPQGLLQVRTLEAYHRIEEGVEDFDARFAAVMTAMDELQQLLEESRAAVEGDVEAVALVQGECERLGEEDPALELDSSLGLVTQATETYLAAEQQRSLGTRSGYQEALALAQKAIDQLEEGRKANQQARLHTGAVREALVLLAPDALSDLRTRLGNTEEQIRAYPRHWTAEVAGVAQEARAELELAEQVLGRLSPEVRQGARFLQSVLGETLEVLSEARSLLERAEESVAKLEGERARIADLRERLRNELDILTRKTMPEIVALGTRMVPELQQRLARLQESVQRGMAAFENVAQVDYGQAIDEWLPAVQRSVAEIRDEHENNLAYYRNLLKDAQRRIDRAWTRVSRLSPQDRPGPEEDVQQLGVDLDAWRAEAERRADEPLGLRETVRSAPALEQRIEAVWREITEGRQALDDLYRQYRKQEQAVEALRSAVEDLRSRSGWSQLVWPTDDAATAWEHALTLEEGSRRAPTLKGAANQLQQALVAAQQAQELYARMEREMSSAVGRLEQELGGVETRLKRAERWAAELRPQGESAELTEVEDALTRARAETESALAAEDFQEALRHLREAASALARVLGM